MPMYVPTQLKTSPLQLKPLVYSYPEFILMVGNTILNLIILFTICLS